MSFSGNPVGLLVVKMSGGKRVFCILRFKTYTLRRTIDFIQLCCDKIIMTQRRKTEGNVLETCCYVHVSSGGNSSAASK